MAATERIIFQPYVPGKRGSIARGQAITCRDQAEAQRRADKAMAGALIIGAHIVRLMVDEEAGDYGDPEFLGIIGTVPEGE